MVRYLASDDPSTYRAIRSEALSSDPDAFGETSAAFAKRTNDDLGKWLAKVIEAERKAVVLEEKEGRTRGMCGFGISDTKSDEGFLGAFSSIQRSGGKGSAKTYFEKLPRGLRPEESTGYEHTSRLRMKLRFRSIETADIPLGSRRTLLGQDRTFQFTRFIGMFDSDGAVRRLTTVCNPDRYNASGRMAQGGRRNL